MVTFQRGDNYSRLPANRLALIESGIKAWHLSVNIRKTADHWPWTLSILGCNCTQNKPSCICKGANLSLARTLCLLQYGYLVSSLSAQINSLSAWLAYSVGLLAFGLKVVHVAKGPAEGICFSCNLNSASALCGILHYVEYRLCLYKTCLARR